MGKQSCHRARQISQRAFQIAPARGGGTSANINGRRETCRDRGPGPGRMETSGCTCRYLARCRSPSTKHHTRPGCNPPQRFSNHQHERQRQSLESLHSLCCLTIRPGAASDPFMTADSTPTASDQGLPLPGGSSKKQTGNFYWRVRQRHCRGVCGQQRCLSPGTRRKARDRSLRQPGRQRDAGIHHS